MRRRTKPSLKHVVSLRITDDEREFLDKVKRKTKVSISSVMREAFLQVISQAVPLAERGSRPLSTIRRPGKKPLPVHDRL